MKTTLLRLSRRAACLVLAGGLLTSCSLLPAASPRHEGTAASQAPQYYSDAWLSDDSLHYVYSYVGNGGGTILRGGRVLYKASSSDSIQLLKDTLTGETGHYLVAHSTPGTEERTSTLYDADGNAVMTFPYAVNATLSGGLLILRDDADVWAFENGTTGGTRVYDLATGAQLPVPETALGCLVVDEGGQRLVFNCYDLPEGLTYAYDDPDQPLHQYVLITDREGNVLMREDGCTASSLASHRGGFADWLDLSWYRGSDWGIAREALYNVTTGELLTGDGQLIAVCGCGGDRDRTKRPEMAAMAVKYAATAIFTSDNPRHEDPESILDEMVAGLPPEARYLRIADRGEAIRAAAMLARPGDIVLLAGKGHETYQIVGDERRHFDDRQQIEHQFSIHR